MATGKQVLDKAIELKACEEAREWLKVNRDKTYEELWDECLDGSWMLWWAGRLGIDRKLLVTAACECARLALPHVPDGEDRPRIAIETALAWTRGEATLKQVRDAADACYYAAAAYTVCAAAYADADDAAAAATVAAYAADVATARAAADDCVAAYAATLRQCADIVRRIIPIPEF